MSQEIKDKLSIQGQLVDRSKCEIDKLKAVDKELSDLLDYYKA